MGLDVYFNRKPLHRHIKKSYTDIITEINMSDNKEFKSVIEDLYNYTCSKGMSFERILTDLISNHLSAYADNNSDGEEVAYFRKLWWIIYHFNYKDEDYGKDIEITKSQIEDLVTMSKKLILMVEKHFVSKGFEIENSPLNYNNKTIRWGGDRSDYLTFKNSLITDDMIDEADEICRDVLDSNDDFLFYKVCEIYIQFSKVLEETNFDEERIYMNADW